MKKAIINTGGKQYIVSEGDTIRVELLNGEKPVFTPLLVIDGDKVTIGKPEVAGAKVEAKVVEEASKDPKVVAIRYKAKKRVNKKRGHRQQKTVLEITKIS